MKRTQHRELLAVIKTLEKVHEEIQHSIEAGRVDVAQNLLVECQTSAIEIGNVIEAEEGGACEAVRSLEEYCEVVYQIHSQIVDGIEPTKAAKVLKKKLLQVESSIRNHIPVQIEILFLPYKRSMWDSMESVWKAAKEDASCEALVMPIPYFDKNADGSLGEMYYEGGTFEMPILNYETYDIATNRPDVIVVHNPYDQCNRVTTIHPNFYMKNIKQWTDKLVYIPYFVHQKDTVKSQYCFLPGTIYPDLVVLQSEEVKKQYIQYFAQAAGTRLGLEKRFQALGSPKLDIPDTGEDEPVPDEWNEMIYRNGSKRKIIFLNIHISCIMQKEAQDDFFQKMQEIFAVFKNNEKVLLLWRPHPLMVSTAKAMNPEAVEPYLALVKRYKEEQIGIYDESPDFQRAVRIADAYYGTGSSVMELFRVIGKPIMHMNMELHKGDRK